MTSDFERIVRLTAADRAYDLELVSGLQVSAVEQRAGQDFPVQFDGDAGLVQFQSGKQIRNRSVRAQNGRIAIYDNFHKSGLSRQQVAAFTHRLGQGFE